MLTSSASGFVKGLRDADLPVSVLQTQGYFDDRARFKDRMADLVSARTNQICVTTTQWVFGLERPIVVWLQGRLQGSDDHRSDEFVDAIDRLQIVSRCTTQLIVVEADRSGTCCCLLLLFVCLFVCLFVVVVVGGGGGGGGGNGGGGGGGSVVPM
jgi:hypothetical protein